jgi:hypothetical protein
MVMGSASTEVETTNQPFAHYLVPPRRKHGTTARHVQVYVSLGSLGDIVRYSVHVRSIPKNGHHSPSFRSVDKGANQPKRAHPSPASSPDAPGSSPSPNTSTGPLDTVDPGASTLVPLTPCRRQPETGQA